MRKTIKITALILAIILGLAQLSTTVYAMSIPSTGITTPGIEIDTTGPKIVSVSADKTMLKPGETITFNMEVEDDSSGSKSFYVQWVSKEDPNKTLHKQYDSMTDIGTYQYTIPEHTLYGQWEAMQVGLYDNQDNFTYYNRYDSEFISKFDFEVENVGQDITPPVVKNVKRITESVTAPGKVIIQFDVIDNESEISYVSVGYSPAGNLNELNFESARKIVDNTYQVDVNVKTPYTKLVFGEIQASDKAENIAFYKYEDLGMTNELDITPTNYIEDNTAPKLLSYEYTTNELYIPDYVEIIIDVEEKESGLGGFIGNIFVESEDGSFARQYGISRKIGNDGLYEGNKCESRLDFGDGETFRGDLYVSKIELQDEAGNKKEYSVKDGTLEKKKLTIKKVEKTYTLTTRTTKTGYIDEIANLPEGSTVLCDVLQSNPVIEKELFNAIKGKDITVTFMSLYNSNGQITSTSGGISSVDSNIGMQWIINGKDIVNETKDVDMVVKIKENTYSKYIIPEHKLDIKYEEEFWNNVRPNEITEEELLQKEKEFVELQKQKATEYFEKLKKDGYVNTDQALKNTIALLGLGGIFPLDEAIKEANEHTDYVSLEFADNGVLPCKTLIRIKPHFALRTLIGAEDLKVYFVEGDKYSLIQENIDLDLEKYYNFTITHNSEYVLANAAFDKLEKVENNGNVSTGGEPEQDKELGSGDAEQDDTNKDDTSKDDVNKDDANKDDANKDETNKDDTNKEESSNTDKKEEPTTDNKDKEETSNNNKLDETPNTGSVEVTSIISIFAVILLAGIIILKRK